ncbi:hypothetical protein QUA04_29385 [Microcoleus sp. S13_C5]
MTQPEILKMDYKLEKQVWTDADFEQMGWHDCNVYKIRLTDDLELDIDYILQWNKPDLEGLPFTFWVAPATLVFKSVQQLTFDFDIGFENAFEIEDIEKEEGGQWTIITGQGDIQFRAEGYEQYIRQEPFFEFGQAISFINRNGHSLDRTTNQANPNRTREDVVQQRLKDVEDYENVKKRHLKKQELEQLLKAKESNEIDTKQYLLKKKEISDQLFSYDYFLKGTKFESW